MRERKLKENNEFDGIGEYSQWVMPKQNEKDRRR